MRKICVITGTRSEYGLLKPVIKAIQDDIDLQLELIVTGMHLSSEFGYSLEEIQKDGFKIKGKVEMNPLEDTGLSRSLLVKVL